MKRILYHSSLAIAILACLLYAGDDLVLRYKVSKGRGLGSVTVYRYYSIEKKANKVEYDFLDSQAQTCVHAMFPHMDYAPCWYLQRHTEKRIAI